MTAAVQAQAGAERWNRKGSDTLLVYLEGIRDNLQGVNAPPLSMDTIRPPAAPLAKSLSVRYT